MMNAFSQRGSALILVASIMVMLMLGGAGAIRMGAQFDAKRKSEALRKNDAFYATELALWQGYATFLANPTENGSAQNASIALEYPADAKAHNYPTPPPYQPPTTGGQIPLAPQMPKYVRDTAALDSSRSLAQRYDGSNVSTQLPGTAPQSKSICSEMKLAGQKYRYCLTAEWVAPKLDLTGNGTTGTIEINSGDSVDVTWSALTVTQCELTQNNSLFSTLVSGKKMVGPLTSNTKFDLKCKSPRGPASKTLTVNIKLGPPLADLKVNGSDGPVYIPYQTAATLSWTSQSVTQCNLSPLGLTGLSNSGTSTGILTATTSYTLTCSGPGGASNDAVTVKVGGNVFVAYRANMTAGWGSRQAYTNFCNSVASNGGMTGQWKALMCLYDRPHDFYHRGRIAAADAGQPLNARDYIRITGPIINMAGQTVAESATQFWSNNHRAGFNYNVSGNRMTGHGHVRMGCNTQGVYTTSCGSMRFKNGHKQASHPSTCNCDNWTKTTSVGEYEIHGLPSAINSEWAVHMVRSTCSSQDAIVCVLEY